LDDGGGEKPRSTRSLGKTDRLKPTTINKTLRHVLAILNRLGPRTYGNPDGLGKIDVVPYVKPLAEDPGEPRTATDQEINKIYRSCHAAYWPVRDQTGVSPREWWQTLLVVVWNLGLRRNDLLSLRFDEISLPKGQLIRKSEKTRKRKPKPLHPVVIEHLARIWPKPGELREFVFGVPDSRRQLYQWWYEIQRDAGIAEPYYTFHQIRKTCGTALYEHAPGAAQAMLEHSSISTTEKYYANSDPILKRAVEKLTQPAAFLGGDDPDDRPATIPFRAG
jgi:integrase